MTDALSKALANAASNMPKGEELHIENLDSIADPSLDKFDPNRDGVLTSKTSFPNPRTEFELLQNYQQQMESEYAEKVAASNATSSSIHHLSVLTQVISDKTNWIQQQLTEIYAQLSRIETTITTAAQSMPESPNHKHRSLHEWDDQYLINELVERENDLMPFYYELLKRIGSPELQSLVMSSMQGKNNSMVTLAQLCAAMGSMIQPQPKAYEVGLSPSAEQRMDEAFHAATTPQTYTQAQLDNLRSNGQSSGITVEEIALYEKMKRNSPPSYPATIPPMPPTYNPFFKEQ